MLRLASSICRRSHVRPLPLRSLSTVASSSTPSPTPPDCGNFEKPLAPAGNSNGTPNNVPNRTPPSRPPPPLREARFRMKKEISALPERKALLNLESYFNGIEDRSPPAPPSMAANSTTHSLPKAVLRPLLRSMLSTFLIHYNSRVASLCSHGYYTIGPCGEESLAPSVIGVEGTVALHYRHLSSNVMRQGAAEDGEWYDVLLDRARAHTVSCMDPVTMGGHCSLGGAGGDVIVTSTLASQCPPAVGRALGAGLASRVTGGGRKVRGRGRALCQLGERGDGKRALFR